MSNKKSYVIVRIEKEEQIANYLRACDKEFIPTLSKRIDIREYARKISENAQIYGVLMNNEICGLCAIYLNNQVEGYITSFNIKRKYQNQGYGKLLMQHVMNEAKQQSYKTITLEVDIDNYKAIAFYKKNSFKEKREHGKWIILEVVL